MLKSQINQYDMLLAVENHFDNNASIWGSIAPISEAKTALSAKIDELAKEVSLQVQNRTGVTEDKIMLRKDLEEKGFILSAALSSYATTHPGMKEMYKRIHFTKSHFLQLRESELIGTIAILSSEAYSAIEELLPYGVTAATLTELKTANDAFRSIMNEPGKTSLNGKNTGEGITNLLHQATSLLENKIDNLIEAIGTSQQQFVSVYFNLRTVLSSGSQPLSLTITTLDESDNSPLIKANIAIAGEDISRISGRRGYNRVQNLKEGNYKLTITRPNFSPKAVPFNIINGQTTQLIVKMKGVMEKVIE